MASTTTDAAAKTNDQAERRTRPLKINCDLGESFGHFQVGCDAQIMPLINCANIACGFHGGDASIIRQTLTLAKHYKVEIGAHVSYPDLQGFGRRSMAIRKQALIDLIHYQISALDGMARIQGRAISYVKPHGALYNDMMKDSALLTDIMDAVASWHKPIDLMILATPRDEQFVEMALERGLTLRFEAFADRAYTDSGYLMARDKPGALLTLAQSVAQARAIAVGELTSARGKKLNLIADSLCVHGDNPEAVTTVKAIREAFNSLANVCL